jgi:hypothetical protein
MILTRAARLALAVGLAVAVAPGAAPSASAQDAFPRPVRVACTADAKRLCPAYRLGSPEMRTCMEAKGRLLSRGCVHALEDAGIAPRGYLGRR